MTAETRAARGGELLFALAAAGLGVFVVVDATRITVPGSVNMLGPRFFPYLVGVALIVTAVVVGWRVVGGHVGQPEEGEDVDASAGTDWPTVVKLVAVFLAHVVVVQPLGWPLAATLLFAGAAWSLGAKPGFRLLVIALALAFGVYLVFRHGLNVYLPAGIFEGVPILDG